MSVLITRTLFAESPLCIQYGTADHDPIYTKDPNEKR